MVSSFRGFMYKNDKYMILSEIEIRDFKESGDGFEKKFLLMDNDGAVDLEDGLFPRDIYECEHMIHGDFWDWYETGDESTYEDFKICVLSN